VNPIVGAGFIPARFPGTIMLSGGHKARPYISEWKSSSFFKTKIRGFRTDTNYKNYAPMGVVITSKLISLLDKFGLIHQGVQTLNEMTG